MLRNIRNIRDDALLNGNFMWYLREAVETKKKEEEEEVVNGKGEGEEGGGD